MPYSPVVLSRSKIKISKAIHNSARVRDIQDWVVLSRSKIKISKAIHNKEEHYYDK